MEDIRCLSFYVVVLQKQEITGPHCHGETALCLQVQKIERHHTWSSGQGLLTASGSNSPSFTDAVLERNPHPGLLLPFDDGFKNCGNSESQLGLQAPTVFSRDGFCHVGQAGLELLTSGYPPTSASQSVEITGVSYNAQPRT
ncbi:hypothetical protein AAY473_015814, partial [Plecturocebus cupreus]